MTERLLFSRRWSVSEKNQSAIRLKGGFAWGQTQQIIWDVYKVPDEKG